MPRWVAGIEEALAHPRDDDLPEAASDARPALVVEPLIRLGRRRVRRSLHAMCSDCPSPPFDPDALEQVAARQLRRSLDDLLARACVLELNVARLEGRLSGETPEERFGSFFAGLAATNAKRALLEAYPVAARQAWLRVETWAETILEFARRLCEDWPLLAETFWPGAVPGALVDLRMDMGDTHRRGRAVAVATFAGGLRLVYKPRSLAVDRHFHSLLAWLDRRAQIGFRAPALIDRGTHGWVEFVATEDCAAGAEVRRFYHRQGAYLALLHALGATDFHYENVVAAGEHPVLVDLETLFHPEIADEDGRVPPDPRGVTPLRVGLLPVRVRRGAAVPDAVDLSGVGAPRRMSEQLPGWQAEGTDRMHLVEVQEQLSATHHRPTLRAADVDPGDYAADVCAGFRRMYRVLCRHRDALLAGAGPIRAFREDEVRVIVRPTRTYGVLLYESTHPDVLRDIVDRDRLLDNLRGPVEHVPLLARLIPAERADLDAGDVPMFTTTPASRALRTAAGERLEAVLQEPGLDVAARRLREFGPQDLERQAWVVRAALTGASSEGGALPRARHGQRRTPATMPPGLPRDRFLAEAARIGDRVCELAFPTAGACSWLMLSLDAGGQWEPLPMRLGLYDGLPGVALFLAQLSAATADERYGDCARGAVATMSRLLELEDYRPEGLGGFTGWGGVLYAMAHLASAWRSERLLTQTLALLDAVEPLIAGAVELDLMNGIAGCSLALLAAARATGSTRASDLANRCGERLLATARPMGHGLAWPAAEDGRPLTGLSHGASGIGLALLELWAVTGDRRFRAAALSGFAFERSLFCPDASNWRDVRAEHADARGFGTAWCHGAPGIGLARMRALALVDDEETALDARAAVRGTLAGGFGANHSLCPGDSGNLELLLRAHSDEAGRVASSLVAVGRRRGWRCDAPAGLDSPELMTGLAGIGHELLRLASPRDTPSVLTLEPPTGRGCLP